MFSLLTPVLAFKVSPLQGPRPYHVLMLVYTFGVESYFSLIFEGASGSVDVLEIKNNALFDDFVE